MSKNINDVLAVLSHTTWLAGLEIREAVAELRLARDGFGPISQLVPFFSHKEAVNMHKHNTLSTIYLVLEELESAEMVESRWRDEPAEMLKERAGHRRREYRLTKRGLLQQTKQAQETPQGGLQHA